MRGVLGFLLSLGLLGAIAPLYGQEIRGSIVGNVTHSTGAAVPGAGPLQVRLSGFRPGEGGLPTGWKNWAPRNELMPRTFIDTVHFRTGPGSLAVCGNSNPAEVGGWEYLVEGVRPGAWYRFVAWYKSEGLTYEPVQAFAKLNWIAVDGKRVGPPDFPVAVSPEGGWTRLTMDAAAPEKAGAVKLQLLLANAPQATIWWDDISFEKIPAPRSRPVTIATIRFEPKGTGSATEAVRRCIEVMDKTVTGKTDVILIGETITWAGTRGPYIDVAEPVPGPTTARLGEVARARKTYIAAGLVEREGTAIYNTAVLIDRDGRLAGKYRKVNLPYDEFEDGLTPGSEYPVFQTDFGKVGMMICWDSQFPDAARALALQGAEIILMPIWDWTAPLALARAIENQIFLVTSSYGDPSVILDPNGEQVASATNEGTAAIATIDLSRRYKSHLENLGIMRERIVRELHAEVPVKRPGFVQ
jgi:predicted amidohydrolase